MYINDESTGQSTSRCTNTPFRFRWRPSQLRIVFYEMRKFIDLALTRNIQTKIEFQRISYRVSNIHIYESSIVLNLIGSRIFNTYIYQMCIEMILFCKLWSTLLSHIPHSTFTLGFNYELLWVSNAFRFAIIFIPNDPEHPYIYIQQYFSILYKSEFKLRFNKHYFLIMSYII